MAKETAAPGLPAVTVRLAADGAYLMATPAIRIERRRGEVDRNFRHRIARYAKRVGYAVSGFENANGEALPKPTAPASDGERGARRVQVIFLHGRDALQVARGPREFRLERQEGETEVAFQERALDEAEKRHLSWLAFERPAIPVAPAMDDGEAA